jgi:hypothetical protein
LLNVPKQGGMKGPKGGSGSDRDDKMDGVTPLYLSLSDWNPAISILHHASIRPNMLYFPNRENNYNQNMDQKGRENRFGQRQRIEWRKKRSSKCRKWWKSEEKRRRRRGREKRRNKKHFGISFVFFLLFPSFKGPQLIGTNIDTQSEDEIEIDKKECVRGNEAVFHQRTLRLAQSFLPSFQ